MVLIQDVRFKIPSTCNALKKMERGNRDDYFPRLRWVESDEFDQFRAIMTGKRRQYLRYLDYGVVLPDDDCSEEELMKMEPESEQQQHANNQDFTNSIMDLWSMLKQWENDGVRQKLQLSFGPVCHRNRGKSFPREVEDRVIDATKKDTSMILEERHGKSHIQLLRPDRLPSLSNPRTLAIIQDPNLRQLSPAIGPILAGTLPPLEDVTWKVRDPSPAISASQRRLEQGAFVRAMRHVRLEPRSKVDIDLGLLRPVDQRLTAETLVPSAMNYDPFSASIRMISHNLTILNLRAHIDPTLFWPSKDEAVVTTPEWPSLRQLSVTFSMVAPTGAWYFTGEYDPDEDDPPPGEFDKDDEIDSEEINSSNFRDALDPNMINPLVLALARAVPKMPALEQMDLSCYLREFTFRIAYYRPDPNADLGYEDSSQENWNVGEGDDPDVDYDHAHLSSRRLYCHTDGAWKPSEIMMKGLRRAGEAKYGGRCYERIFYRSYRDLLTADCM